MTLDSLPKEQLKHLEEHSYDKISFGFWVYLMTDLVMFGTLFAAFAVLRNNIHDAISMQEIYNGPFVLSETLILLTSSFTCGLGLLAAHWKNKNLALMWFGITFLLGVAFLGLELSEFTKLFSEGNSFMRSAFLSSFFTLVGTHGLHITSGLLWMFVCMVWVFARGLTVGIVRKLTLLSLFWHFLDIVWIFIFTVVYLIGAL